MSDAADRAAALILLTEWLQPTVAPTLTTTASTGEVDVILDRNIRAATRANATAYTVGQLMMPSTRNGHRYRCTVGGTSAAADPFLGSTWPTEQGARITEGTSSPALTWIEDGPEFSSIYDVRQAAYEGWILRAHKAAQFFKAGELEMNQMYEHAMRQARQYGSLAIG